MNNFVIHPLASPWLAILFLLPLGYFLWREYQRKLRFRSLRLFAQVILFLALLGFYFRPGFNQQKAATPVLVLTPGYTATSVDSVIQSEKEFMIVHQKGVPSYRGSIKLSDRDLERYASSIHWVAGEGFSLAELERLKDVRFQFLPTSIPEGIQSLDIPPQMKVGNTEVISGTVHSSKSQWLRLSGPGGVEDSVLLPIGRSSFHLSVTPKNSGPLLYHVQLGDGVKEPVPVVVTKEDKLRILFLQKYPTAEARALKNFLEEKGHALAVRHQISKDNFLFSFANTTPMRFTFIDEKLLQDFDVLVIDEASLGSFSQLHQAALLAAIDDGLGVHVLPWEEFKNMNWLFPSAPQKTDQDTLHIKGRKNYVLQRTKHQWNESDGMIPIWKAKDNIITGYFLRGKGKISTQAIAETFPIRFQGDESDYAKIWSQLLTRVARTKSKEQINMLQSIPYYTGSPLTLQLISSQATPALKADDVPVSLREEAFVDQVWTGKIRVGEAGWHTLTSTEDTLHYWVSNREEWKTLGLAQQLHQNKLKQSTDKSVASAIQHVQEIPLIWFFLMFLLASGFLWLAPKL